MARALKFVKVSVTLPDKSSFPAALYGSPHINTSYAPAGQRAGSLKDDSQGFSGLDRGPPSARRPEPSPHPARIDEAADTAHLQIKPAGRRYRARVAVEGEAVRRPFVLVGGVADAEIESVEVLHHRLIDQVLQQQMADAIAAQLRVVARENIIEPSASDEAEMRRCHRVADRQRRKMTDLAEPTRTRHLTIKLLDTGYGQKIRR